MRCECTHMKLKRTKSFHNGENRVFRKAIIGRITREDLLDHMKLKLTLEYEKGIHTKGMGKAEGEEVQGEGKELERPEGEVLSILKKRRDQYG